MELRRGVTRKLCGLGLRRGACMPSVYVCVYACMFETGEGGVWGSFFLFCLISTPSATAGCGGVVMVWMVAGDV